MLRPSVMAADFREKVMGTPIVLLLFLGLVWSEAMESWRRGEKILSWLKHTLKWIAVRPGGRCAEMPARPNHPLAVPADDRVLPGFGPAILG